MLKTNDAPDGDTHYATLLLHVADERREAVVTAVARLPGVQPPPEGESLVVLVEAPDLRTLAERATDIELLSGVRSATLLDHWVEPPVRSPICAA